MKAYFFLFLAISFEIIGTSFLKLSNQFTNLLQTVIAIASYFIAFFFLSLVLKTMPVGIAYAIWSGIGIICITLIGIFIFKQNLDLPAFIGLSLIIVGVIIINLFSNVKID